MHGKLHVDRCVIVHVSKLKLVSCELLKQAYVYGNCFQAVHSTSH